MSRLAVFGLGILCGMTLEILLIGIYVSIRTNHIDKK